MTTGDKSITVVNVEEQEDGGATYTFEVPDEITQVCGEYGLKLLMYCGVLEQSPECVFKSLEREIQNLADLTTKEDIRRILNDRIEELEAKLARYNDLVADKIDLQSENIALKAKLAKAVDALEFYGTLIGEKHECPWHMNSEDFGEKARTTLAELTGDTDAY